MGNFNINNDDFFSQKTLHTICTSIPQYLNIELMTIYRPSKVTLTIILHYTQHLHVILHTHIHAQVHMFTEDTFINKLLFTQWNDWLQYACTHVQVHGQTSLCTHLTKHL